MIRIKSLGLLLGLSLGFLFSGVSGLRAQQFGSFPPSVKWQQISTDTARVIFEAEARPQAQRIAAIIHQMAAQQPNSLGSGLRKINIVLHSNTTRANGYVGLAPFRSEYYLVPGSNIFELGSLPWNEHLAIHEYRHVQQYNNMNKGLTKAFRFVLGEEGQALANSMTVPDWFFEGDAVHAETATTPQGRGRLPYFLSGYNSLFLEGKRYSRMKLLNGSLKDYVPNHYQFGYLAVNYGYEKYGSDFWANVVDDAASFRGLFYPFRKAIKEHAGVSYQRFIKDALSYHQKDLKRDKDLHTSKKKTVVNYYFPQYIGPDSLLYLKQSYRSLPAFYVRTGGREHKIKLKNISLEDWFSYRNGTIAYTAFSTNARWGLIDFSDIVLLDIHSGSERWLTSKGMYYTPDISPSGQTIAAISVNDSTETELRLLDAVSGQVLKKWEAPRHTYLLHPRFLDEENLIVVQRAPDGTMSLHRMNLESGATERLQTTGFNTIGYPFVQGDTVFFTSSPTGNDELFAMELKDGKTQQLTSGQTGNYYVSAAGDSLAWTKFTADGLQLQVASKASLLWSEVAPASLDRKAENFHVASLSANLLTTAPRKFDVRPYRKGTGLLNFHSWRPYYEDPEFTFSLFSNNILNTFTSEIFYRYNQNEESHGAGINAIYGGWFPQIVAGAEYIFDRHVMSNRGPLVLDQFEVRAGYFIPLNFTRGKTYKNFGFGSNLVWNKLTSKTKGITLADDSQPYLHHYISFSHQLPKARQHIYPKFGYSLSPAYRHRIGEKGYQFTGSGQLYLPSVGNHSIVLSGSFQQVDTNNVVFSNRFALSRGYDDQYFSRMWRASANYHFPIAYPDWGFGGLIYFLRLRGNAFYDISKVYSRDKRQSDNLNSAGGELFFDTKIWNQMPVTIGVRYSYLLNGLYANNGNRHVWEVVLPVSLIP